MITAASAAAQMRRSAEISWLNQFESTLRKPGGQNPQVKSEWGGTCRRIIVLTAPVTAALVHITFNQISTPVRDAMERKHNLDF
jgi:hypothetical protein